jgi:hypothetical protein
MESHREIWRQFCDSQDVKGAWVPLFETTPDGTVNTKIIGQTNIRPVLCRNADMEELVRRECRKLIDDWKAHEAKYDGLIYMMAYEESGEVVPLYIGKTETLGKSGGNLSANIKGIERDTSKFARWGDNYAYHIGDLSAAVLPGHDASQVSRKYIEWGKALFQDCPSESPVLNRPVFFWAKAWSGNDIGIWEQFGPTRLTFLEYLLVGVSSSAFGGTLLNREGQNRTR